MASTLIYITSTFPFGGITEQSFIMPELEPLAQAFDRIILVPEHLNAQAPMCPLPGGVETDTRFAKANGQPASLASQLKDAIHPRFAAALIHGGANMLHYSRFRSLLSFSAVHADLLISFNATIRPNRANIPSTLSGATIVQLRLLLSRMRGKQK